VKITFNLVSINEEGIIYVFSRSSEELTALSIIHRLLQTLEIWILVAQQFAFFMRT